MHMAQSRFEITPRQIDTVVALFYNAARRHDVLGPVFARHITDWPAHEAKIASFWKKAIRHEPGYEGNPMRAHLATGDVSPEHFPLWLELFDETLHRSLPSDAAAAWSTLAHRIGRGLRMGVEDMNPSANVVPVIHPLGSQYPNSVRQPKAD